MNFKRACGGVVVGLAAAADGAMAETSPYSISASETIQHQSNVYHSVDADAISDWNSVTNLRAGVDQLLGRQRLTAFGSFNIAKYNKVHALDNNGYNLGAQLELATVGDLTGAVGGDSSRQLYVYGLNGEQLSTTRNIQNDNHVFGRLQLGGISRWSLFANFDAAQRDYSAPAFAINEERQWATVFGAKYTPFEDTSWSGEGRYTRGKYPNFNPGLGADDFTLKTLSSTMMLKPTGASSYLIRAGYTEEKHTMQRSRHYFSGAFHWTWTPSRVKFDFGVDRDSASDTASLGVVQVNATDVSGHSLNTVAYAKAQYDFSAKTSFTAGAQYTKRDYSDTAWPTQMAVSDPLSVSGSNRTAQFSIGLLYLPTPNSNVSCSVAREKRNSDASLAAVAPGYDANTVSCSGQIIFR